MPGFLKMSWLDAVMQLIGYPVVIWLCWVWLGIAERDALDLASSVVVGLAIVGLLSWLVARAFGAGFGRGLVFVVLASLLVAGVLYRPKWFSFALAFVLLGVLAPALLLPTRRVQWQWRYWAAWFGALLAMVVVPVLLVNWVPQLQSAGAQTASMAARFVVAYGVALGGWLGYAGVARRLAAGGGEVLVVPVAAAAVEG